YRYRFIRHLHLNAGGAFKSLFEKEVKITNSREEILRLKLNIINLLIRVLKIGDESGYFSLYI
ncbi:hypothetical protein, partial [Enterococcus avium]|uniref:hypothetical protein n=1 Tax=Enterococcus avium TaxID=33945 RepID=UPI001C9D6A45